LIGHGLRNAEKKPAAFLGAVGTGGHAVDAGCGLGVIGKAEFGAGGV
jgi:hypothetical protein